MTPTTEIETPPEVAYYYPEWHWQPDEHGWVKSLLLFFDEIALLVPDYKRHQPALQDPVLAGVLEDEGLLRIIEPEWFVDAPMTRDLAEVMVGLITAGAFDDLPKTRRFDELSMSRAGYAGEHEVADQVVALLRERNLATASKDGASIPMHPTVRSTYLVLLAQLARKGGERHGIDLHPATNRPEAAGVIDRTLNLPGMPTRGHVVGFDMQTVSMDLDAVPIDELLDFRNEHKTEHRKYMTNLREFSRQLSAIEDEADCLRLLADRQAELRDAAEALNHRVRKALVQPKNAIGFGLTLIGAGLSVASHSALPVVGVSLSAQLLSRLVPDRPNPDMYSYLFKAQQQLK